MRHDPETWISKGSVSLKSTKVKATFPYKWHRRKERKMEVSRDFIKHDDLSVG